MEEKLALRLTFDPGLSLTAFRTTQPWNIGKKLVSGSQHSTKNSEPFETSSNARRFPRKSSGKSENFSASEVWTIEPKIPGRKLNATDDSQGKCFQNWGFFPRNSGKSRYIWTANSQKFKLEFYANGKLPSSLYIWNIRNTSSWSVLLTKLVIQIVFTWFWRTP